MAEASSLTVGRRSIAVSNLTKVLWPQDGYTKGDLIAYYRAVAPLMLPYLTDRPLTLERFPNGVDGESFFEKQVPRGAPEWVRTVPVPSVHGRRSEIEFVICDDEATLVYLANLAAIVLHEWTSRASSLDDPDFIFFDLDPWDGCTIATLASVALGMRDLLAEIGLVPLVKSSGGSGLHLLIPLAAGYGYEPVKQFAELVARRLHEIMPDATTLQRMTAKRPRGTVYLDYVQVGRGKTMVAPFSVRARAKAPISMPLAWSDVETLRRKRTEDTERIFATWTIANAPELTRHGDPWRGVWKKQRLESALKRARTAWST